jgi:transposase
MNTIRRTNYPSDLTEAQWEEIEPYFVGMRNHKWEKRELVNAVLYFERSGCQWRSLPHDFPPFPTVWSFYRRAKLSGLWKRILHGLVEKTRINAGREASPAYGIIDSQSVKTTAAADERGIDGGKKRKGASGIS